jgi:hypothetical protein
MHWRIVRGCIAGMPGMFMSTVISHKPSLKFGAAIAAPAPNANIDAAQVTIIVLSGMVFSFD